MLHTMAKKIKVKLSVRLEFDNLELLKKLKETIYWAVNPSLSQLANMIIREEGPRFLDASYKKQRP